MDDSAFTQSAQNIATDLIALDKALGGGSDAVLANKLIDASRFHAVRQTDCHLNPATCESAEH
jgi:hypothetical protein